MELVLTDIDKASVDWQKVANGEKVLIQGKVGAMGVKGFVTNLIENGQKFEMIEDTLTENQKEILDLSHIHLDEV